MTPEEEKQVVQWNATLGSDVQVRLITTEDKRGKLLSDFCDHFQKVAPKVAFLKEEGGGSELPAIEINPRFRYHAVPTGRELEPFLLALKNGSSSAFSPPVHGLQEGLYALNMPAFLQLFIAPQCPHCPQTVQQLIPLQGASDHVHLAIVDGALFPELAEKYRIQSVPTLLVDDHFRWTGSVPMKELVGIMVNRDPAKLGASSLESILKEGEASRVAEMMMEAKQIIPSFLDVLTHEKMFVRLGAMVVMEELCERDPSLAQQVVGPLWDRFERASEAIRGDMIHVIGETGDRDSIPRLENLLKGSLGKDMKEAAQDALDRIRRV